MRAGQGGHRSLPYFIRRIPRLSVAEVSNWADCAILCLLLPPLLRNPELISVLVGLNPTVSLSHFSSPKNMARGMQTSVIVMDM